MKITITSGNEEYTIMHFIDHEKKPQLFLTTQDGEGMQLSEDALFKMIDEWLKENF